MGRRRATRWSTVKVLLVLFNVMSTWLTLFKGLQDSPIVSFAMSQQEITRQRLVRGSINLNNALLHQFNLDDLAPLEELTSFTIIKLPRLDATNGTHSTMCTNVNTNVAPVMLNMFDDFWGRGARRLQIYVSSISAPSCEIINVQPAWRDQCIADRGGNATACYEHVLANFDALRRDRRIRMAVEIDYGAPGVPFLRCEDRPLKAFAYFADVLAHQTYWAGGDRHVTIRTSDCQGVPLVESADLEYALFEGVSAGDGGGDAMVVLVSPGGWVVVLIQWTQSLVMLGLVVHGLTLALFHSKVVTYLPYGLRTGSSTGWRKYLRYLFPFMPVVTTFSDSGRSIVSFKGSLLVASDVWITHWLYMWLSMADAVVNLRATYMKLEMSSHILENEVSFSGVSYMCGALTKVAWLMCILQTLLRLFVKLAARCLRSIRLIRSSTREKIEWGIDGICMLVGYRLYYVILFAISFALVLTRGSLTFMVQATPFKVGAFGGVPRLPGFWRSEVACDLVTLLGLLTFATQLLGGLLLCTKYKYVVDNSLMRFLQKRYVISGWDGLLAADVLGLDPNDPDFLVDGKGYTKFSLGSLVQLLYLSGPSGYVHLAGDYIFHDNGFSKEPVRFSYPIPKAMEMGLFESGCSSGVSTSTPHTDNSQKVGARTPSQRIQARESATGSMVAKQSIFERRLRIVSDGYFGRVLLIDAAASGLVTTNVETGRREYEVVDALTTMSIMDIKWLISSNDKKIRAQ